jgi:hypothetical protein
MKKRFVIHDRLGNLTDGFGCARGDIPGWLIIDLGYGRVDGHESRPVKQKEIAAKSDQIRVIDEWGPGRKSVAYLYETSSSRAWSGNFSGSQVIETRSCGGMRSFQAASSLLKTLL